MPRSHLYIKNSPIHIFLDGSSKNDGDEVFGGLGFSVFGICSAPLQFCAPVDHENPTNNVAELSCFIKVGSYILTSQDAPAIQQRGVKLFFDSTFALNSIMGQQNRSKNDEALYGIQREAWLLWEEIKEFTEIECQHVYAHAGIIPNELSDQLADEGRRGIVKDRICLHTEIFGSPQAQNVINVLPPNHDCNPRYWSN